MQLQSRKRARSPESEERDTEHRSPTEHTISTLSSLRAPVSPPQRRGTVTRQAVETPEASSTEPNSDTPHGLAAIEAGDVEVTDHLNVFSTRLTQCARPLLKSQPAPRLPIDEWVDLYRRNAHPEGRHFVIHQHDHPVAGPHYDLRLQFSHTSSVSWSIMYGLPGDPNSQRLNRNAAETRIHCLWNHLIETASSTTGSLIIWDTGEYEILPYNMDPSLPETDDSRSDISDDNLVSTNEPVSDSAKLREAFQNRKIRLRLRGSRLPKGYTVLLRMDKSTDFARPIRNGPKRRRRAPQSTLTVSRAPSTSDSDSPQPRSPHPRSAQGPSSSSSSKPQDGTPATEEPRSDQGNHSDDNIDLAIQKNNAYPGSSNTIGSIHQRRWYLSLDRVNSGFEPKSGSNGGSRAKKIWVRKSSTDQGLLGFDPFYVRGPDVERSVVTGRMGPDVLTDEGVEGFLPRKGWRPVLN